MLAFNGSESRAILSAPSQSVSPKTMELMFASLLRTSAYLTEFPVQVIRALSREVCTLHIHVYVYTYVFASAPYFHAISFPRANLPGELLYRRHTFCNLPPRESKLMPPAYVLHPVPARASILIADKIRDYPRNMCFMHCIRECI